MWPPAVDLTPVEAQPGFEVLNHCEYLQSNDEEMAPVGIHYYLRVHVLPQYSVS